MPQGQAASADLDQTPAIRQAIFTILTTQCGVNFTNPQSGLIQGKQGQMPLPEEVTGKPFAVVLQPTLVGGMFRGQLVPGKIPRQSGMSEPVHDWLAYVLYPARDPTNPATVDVPEQAKNLIEQAFTINWSLQKTVTASEILDCTVLPQFEFTKPAHSQPYTVVRLKLRSAQRLYVDYTGGY
jgi:hypothetical protein